MPANKVVNWEGGSDARYDTSQMWEKGGGVWTDGTYEYDSEGRPLSAIPGGNDWTPGLPGARGGNSPSGGGGGGGGYNPYFAQQQAAIEAQRAAAAADRKATIKDLLIAFGMVPEGFEDPYGDIDQTTRDLAKAKTDSGLSAVARMREALQLGQRDSSRDLTSRGLRRSGDRGFQMRKNQLAFDRNYTDAIAQVLGGARGIYSSFAQGEFARQSQLAQALASSMQNWNWFPRNSGPQPQPAQPDPYVPPTWDHTPVSAPYLSAPATTPWSPQPKERRSGI